MYDTDLAVAMEQGKIEGIIDKGDYYLVNMRITGTGIKTRVINGEAVDIDRPKDYFLSAHFLQECRGLPVTVEHPEERVNKDTFGECVIGAIFHPYVREDEVWGVAKIYDTATVRDMLVNQLSTSPNVISANLFFKRGEPHLEDYEAINHVAIVREGFWDNGKPAIILKEGDMSDKRDNLSHEAILAEIERDDRLREAILAHLHKEEKDKADEKSKENHRDSIASSPRVTASEKVDDESKEARLAVEERDDRLRREAMEHLHEREKADEMSKEARLAESERDNRLEGEAIHELHEREKDKRDNDLLEALYRRIDMLEAELRDLKRVEKAEGAEWEILAEEHEELSDEHLETEALEEEMIDTRDSLYDGVKSSFKVLRAVRREMPEKYMLRSIRANASFLSDENKQIASVLHPRQHKQAVRRLYADFKDSVREANVKSVGESKADIPLVRKENGVVYTDNYLRRLMSKIGGK